MKKLLIATLLILMSFTTVQAKEEVVFSKSLVEVNPINVSSNAQTVEGFVARMYRLVLGREPENGGFEYWVNSLKSKKIDGADTVVGFFESKELTNKNLSNKEYIKLLYKSVLNREADNSGLNYWFDIMNQKVTKTYILKGFAESTEFTNLCSYYKIDRGYVIRTLNRDLNLNVTRFINRLYLKCLNRESDVSGLEHWASKVLNEKMTGAHLVKNFVDSQEMKDRKLSNKDYVTVLYNAMFDREPDKSGFNGWVKKLDEGTIREDVLAGFVSSQEFRNLCDKYGITAGSLPSSDVVEGNAAAIINYLVETLGYRKAIACGIAANMWHESGFRPAVYDFSGTYYGLCQWGGGRRRYVFTWCEENGFDPGSIKGQLHFMDYELKNSYPNTYQRLLGVAESADGASDAANIFVRGYEGASIDGGRYRTAYSYYNQY